MKVLKILLWELRNLFPSVQLQNEREDLCSGTRQQDRSSGSSCRKEGNGEERRVPGAQSRREEGLGDQPAVVMKVKEDVLETLKDSREITKEYCKNRNIIVRLMQSILRLLAPML